MKQLLALVLFFCIIGLTAQNETDCNCCSPEHRQFDFWLGDWEVYNSEGEKIGENLIEKIEDNCLISEKWKGKKGSTGRSFNYFDPADSTWNQLWISNTGNILKLKGKAKANKMILKSHIVNGEKGKYYNQITWTQNGDGSVTQLWEILDENDKFLSETFKGVYRKKDY
ncbi:hypothetical protein [Gramella sp. KN1008]|uniref:hypothetical protein n=1 Tax=Gramella sp. KN1008 TaxID=2529298 RepID=UPI00103CDF9E|nr:hypothetical protein [Gramella sp. KN1008]TBW27964.1 hypothetical protein EZJ28_09525 [Gramella sp. KN1008]